MVEKKQDQFGGVLDCRSLSLEMGKRPSSTWIADPNGSFLVSPPGMPLKIKETAGSQSGRITSV